MDKNDGPKRTPQRPLTEGLQKFRSLHPQGSKDHSGLEQSFFQRSGAGGEGAQSREVSLGSTPAPREGLPTTDILLQGKPHKKRGNFSGLWPLLTWGPSVLAKESCPSHPSHEGRVGVMVHMVQMWSGGVCRLVRYIQYLTPGVQLYVLLAISVDRFYTIVYPLSFKVSRGKAKKMILASWLCGALFASPACFLYGSNSEQHCNFFLPSSWQGSAYSIIHLLLVFMIPSFFIILFYQKVIKYIWRIGTDGMTVRRTTNIVPRAKVKTIKMFLMLNSMFFLSWLPFFLVQLWHPQETDYRESSLLFLAITWISFSSSASKPTLYSIYNANFRRGMKETFCMSAMKCYRSNAYTITTSSRIAKKNHVGIADIPATAKSVTKDSTYDAFNREAKERKLAWPIPSNPPNTFV
uniref:Probable G-protein coupled receptor 19 n=1 Tax=Junco hyemalis TaxID=40217 RepID=A0A8C5J094_JUNHY